MGTVIQYAQRGSEARHQRWGAHGKLIASDIKEHIATIRTMAQQAQLSETCLERMHKAPCGQTLGTSPLFSGTGSLGS